MLLAGLTLQAQINVDVKKTIKDQPNCRVNQRTDQAIDESLDKLVEGHTDSDGTDDYNMKFSKARGEAVMNYLVGMGISSDRLVSNGWGETKPIDNNTTAEGKANNRRVEFVKF